MSSLNPIAFVLIALAALLLAPVSLAQTEQAPRIERLTSEDGAPFEAHVFEPMRRREAPRAAIVLLHGGGWVAGDATWVYPRARRFAEQGLVAIAVNYRLANQGAITPRQSTADTRAVFRWLRDNARALNIDPDRIAAYGVSAGGQLSLSAAQSADPAARPNAIVLVSPAVDLARDSWFTRLMGGRDAAAELAPIANVRAGLPPTLILQGDVDSETPLTGARAYCELARAAGGACVLKVYVGYGHLFTPAGINDRDSPQPDPAISATAAEFADGFLRSHGYMQ